MRSMRSELHTYKPEKDWHLAKPTQPGWWWTYDGERISIIQVYWDYDINRMMLWIPGDRKPILDRPNTLNRFVCFAGPLCPPTLSPKLRKMEKAPNLRHTTAYSRLKKFLSSIRLSL